MASPPRAPVFTKLEAGDREITLHWALNRDGAVQAYRLYRASTREALEDLRHWDETPDPRLVATVPDPLIRTKGRTIELPGDLDMAAVRGVYRVDEFDFQAAVDDEQERALNHFNSEPSSPAERTSGFLRAADATGTHRIEHLRLIADGTPVVVVYLDSAGTLRRVAQTGGPPYRDSGLVGLRDYYYRLAAVNAFGQMSPGSDIVRGRPLELTKPRPPVLHVERRAISTDRHRVTVTCEAQGAELEIALRRKGSADSGWRTVVPWTPINGSYTFTEEIDRHDFADFQGFCRTRGNVVSEPSRIVRTAPGLGLLEESV